MFFSAHALLKFDMSNVVYKQFYWKIFFPKEKFGNFSVENEKKCEIRNFKIENFILKMLNFSTLNNLFTIIVKME